MDYSKDQLQAFANKVVQDSDLFHQVQDFLKGPGTTGGSPTEISADELVKVVGGVSTEFGPAMQDIGAKLDAGQTPTTHQVDTFTTGLVDSLSTTSAIPTRLEEIIKKNI